jgi:hypothetical protein
MRARILRTTLRGLALAQVRHVDPVPLRSARPPVAGIYRDLETQFGILAPPVALHAPSPDTLSACWLMLRAAMLERGAVERADKETVAATVSAANICPYCVTMHDPRLGGLVAPQDWSAIAQDRPESIADERVRTIALWARAHARAESAASPFTSEQEPEAIAVAVLFEYINRMVNVFLTDLPLPPGVPARAIGVVAPVLLWLTRSSPRPPVEPGAALDLLPDAPVPADLSWAQGSPAVAGAFARAVAAIEAAGERSVPSAVRDVVRAELDAWDGRPRGLSRAWAAQAAQGLAPAERPAARLALLTSMASYQVDESDVAAFQADRRADGDLIELTAWASLEAARRSGARMARSGGATGNPVAQPADRHLGEPR